MFPSAQYLMNQLQGKLNEIQIVGETGNENLSVRRGMALTLRFLEAREQGGTNKMQIRLRGIDKLLEQLATTDPSRSSGASRLRQNIANLLKDQGASLVALESATDQLLLDIEHLLASEHGNHLPPAIVRALVNWEAEDLLTQLKLSETASTVPDESSWQPVRKNSLQDYLRDRFGESDMEVTAFQPLAGGFGKETVMFSVRGRQLNGDFVLRRDRAVNLIANDCHLVRTEYPLLKAVRAHGIPTANALWLQPAHPLLPGADFIVMDRIAGNTGGSVFGTTERLDPSMSELLGRLAAQIHTLPPLTEVGTLTESIRPDSWQAPLRDCVHSYVTNFYKLYRDTPHFSSVAIAAQFDWLLQNIPVAEGHPCLLHGDIGLNNMLLEEGRFNALIDWEFAHVGDPAEDIAYIKSTLGKSLDWDRFMAAYVAHGGKPVSAQRIHFYQIWGLVRNAAGGSMIFGRFSEGALTDPTTMLVVYEVSIQYIRAAQALIDAGA